MTNPTDALPEQTGWHIANLGSTQWFRSDAFGLRTHFEQPNQPFPEIGVNVAMVAPGQPVCRYHRENAQEGFLVLAGEGKLLINDEEHPLRTWDYVHVPAGVSHVIVGAGDGPCTVLMIGRRHEANQLFYPASELAARYGAEAPEPTPDPRIAYSDVVRPTPTQERPWPPQ